MGKKKIAEQSAEELPKDKAAAEGGAAKPAQVKKSRRLESGRVYINASYNNTVITVTDEQGNVITWASAGSIGFSGPKKATPFAASKIIAIISEKLKAVGMSNLHVFLKGIGGGRDSAVRSLANQGFNIVALKDVTPIPHNGPRPRKLRRV
ncbi:MAG: 30S ribosomal protein S11 [Parcubacteria group bacterium GW2011_GWB1_56_8]|nr:MAG: 30S ribosomal protein S11 [Parcubacteria group bacterium GW2011_GWB1_56_8]